MHFCISSCFSESLFSYSTANGLTKTTVSGDQLARVDSGRLGSCDWNRMDCWWSCRRYEIVYGRCPMSGIKRVEVKRAPCLPAAARNWPHSDYHTSLTRCMFLHPPNHPTLNDLEKLCLWVQNYTPQLQPPTTTNESPILLPIQYTLSIERHHVHKHYCCMR